MWDHTLQVDKVIPIELGRKALALVERTHETVSSSGLPQRIATRRNAVAVAMVPEAVTILRAATSTFKIRIFLWVLAGVVLVVSAVLSWWLVILGGLILVTERILANERAPLLDPLGRDAL